MKKATLTTTAKKVAEKLEREIDQQVHNYISSCFIMMDNLGRQKPKEWHYAGQYDFLLQHGKFYKPQELDSTEKLIIKKALRRIGFIPKQKECFYNAQMLALSDHTGKIKYCEGIASHGILPMNHAWIEINGKVVDTTWRDEDEHIFFGYFPDDMSYFGFNVDTKTIRSKQLSTGVACSFLDDYHDKWRIFQKPFNPETK